ncbi:MAG: PD-(D/E)XK nuclease family protein [Catalinimonas sp.]
MFLADLAERTLRQHGDAVGDLAFVFPNRRAGLFFKQHLAARTEGVLLAPEVFSVEEFVAEVSGRLVPDRLTLVFELYQIYREYSPLREEFDRFYPWGELMLADFSELDKYLLDARRVFGLLKDQRTVEAQFAELSEEDAGVIRRFWEGFSAARVSEQKRRFLQLWEALPTIYERFNAELVRDHRGYDGAVFRHAAALIRDDRALLPAERVVFAGFHDLNACEARIIATLVERGRAEVHWDLDAYYVDDETHEAGQFFRRLREHPVLGDTLPAPLPRRFADAGKKQFHAVGVPLAVGQAQAVGHFLAEWPGDLVESETVIVVPDEGLLFPVLHALPERIQQLNVTMGYPLRNTPLFSLLAHLVDLQQTLQAGADGTPAFHHRRVLDLLRHPYVYYHDAAKAAANVADVERYNRVYVRLDQLKERDDFYEALFRRVLDTPDAVVYLTQATVLILSALRRAADTPGAAVDVSLEEEYFFHFNAQLNRLGEVLTGRTPVGLELFWRLFRQLLENLKMPFTGEPLAGLQVMGLLESRNLDFKNVFIVAMNEGVMPPRTALSSFIPQGLRRGWGLPTAARRDAAYAYYFYRLLHHAERVYLLHNTETTSTHSGEPSRWLQQLRLLTDFPIREWVLTNELQPLPPRPVVVRKEGSVLEKLGLFLDDGTAPADDRPPRHLTPSAVNAYLDCSLRFYFRHVARLRTADRVEEELTDASFGSLLHATLEQLYRSLRIEQQREAVTVTADDIERLRNQIDKHLMAAFRRHYATEPGAPFHFEGRNLVAREMIKKYVGRALDHDAAYAPFEIAGLETVGRDGFTTELPVPTAGGTRRVRLKGIIDRIDRKGDVVRVLDYKTGGQDRKFSTVGDLFDPSRARANDTALQVLYYGWLFRRSPQARPTDRVAAGVYKAREMFGDDFGWKLRWSPTGQPRDARDLDDIAEVEEAFEEGLVETLRELFDPDVPFRQTDNRDLCKFCDYQALCHRD